MKKTLNVLGIIMAWLLSIVLVIMLIVTPIAFSTLSLLNVDTVTKVVTDVFTVGVGSVSGNDNTSGTDSTESQPSAENVKIMTLSNTTESANAGAEINVGALDKDMLAGMFGDAVTPEQVDAILSSNTAKELIEAYTGDITNAITGSNQEANFSPEKVKEIVNDNIDEITDLLQTHVPECAEMDKEELKNEIIKAVDENVEEVIQALPKPEELKEQLIGDNPALEIALGIVAAKNTIKLAIIGVIVALSVLIFACRIPGLRGFRWLAVDLFVGGGFGAFVTVGLMVSKTAVGEIAKEAGAQAASVVDSLLGAFTNGMLVRTLVMLAAGGVMLTAYILLKKMNAKKAAESEVSEETQIEESQA